MYMDTTTGCIDLPNGFSFTINRECVHLILDLPLGFQAISFCSTPETVQLVNMEIHGKECTPSVFELADLIRNGLLGSPFTKAFMLLVNCLFLCPTNQYLPSSSYYSAIADEGRIKDFDWCSYVLQWLLLSVNKHQLNAHYGNCLDCGLIPVITYFEFLIAPEIRLQNTIPRLSLWTDNVLKLYAILDANSDSTFGSLTVRKKLRVLSTNLHDTILTNTTRAISNCVDEVLRAFCNEESTDSKGAGLYFNQGSLHCNDLLDDAHVSTKESKSKRTAETEQGIVPTADPISSTRGMIKDMIYYYMESSFPPFDEVQLEDGTLSELLSTHDIFTALVEQFSREPLVPDLGFIDVDEYLSRTLVTKLEISNISTDERYEQMTMLDVCKLNTSSPSVVPEERVDSTGWFVSSPNTKSLDGSERNNSLQGSALKNKITYVDDDFCSPSNRNNDGSANSQLYSASTYGLSLNERLLGRSCPKPTQDNLSEFPSYSLGVEFEKNFSPTTPNFMNVNAGSTKPVSFNAMMDQQTETCPSSTSQPLSFHKSVQYPYSIHPETSSGKAHKNDLHSDGFDCSQGKEWQDAQLLAQNQRLGFHSDSFGGLERKSSESRTVQFNTGSTHGLSCKERTFRPLSLKHVQSDNTCTPSEMLFEDSKMNFSGPSAESFATKRPSATFTRDCSAAQHLKFDSTMCDKKESCPSSTKKKQHKVSFVPDSFMQTNANFTRMNSNQNFVNCTLAEDELFTMLTSNITEIVFSNRIFEIEERWTDERTLARCMSNGGYINEYVMDAFVKMLLFYQRMKDKHGEKIGFLKHIMFSEISEALMYQALDLNCYKKLLTGLVVGFRLEHAGLVHIPCSITKQWFLVVANFMDKSFDVLNPSHNSDTLSDTINAIVHNFQGIIYCCISSHSEF